LKLLELAILIRHNRVFLEKIKRYKKINGRCIMVVHLWWGKNMTDYWLIIRIKVAGLHLLTR